MDTVYLVYFYDGAKWYFSAAFKLKDDVLKYVAKYHPLDYIVMASSLVFHFSKYYNYDNK